MDGGGHTRTVPPRRAATPSQRLSRDILRTFSRLPSLEKGLPKPQRRNLVPVDRISAPRSVTPQVDTVEAVRMICSDTPVAPVSSPSLVHDEAPPTRGDPLCFSDQVNRHLDHELRLLRSVGEPSPLDRVFIFRNAARRVVDAFPTYGGVLSRIFDEYDAFVDIVAQRERGQLSSQGSLGTQLQDAQRQLSACTLELEDLKRENARRTARLERSAATLTPMELAEKVDVLERRLDAERAQRREAEAKLLQSRELSESFTRAVDTMERNFQRVLEEKVEEVAAARQEAAQRTAEAHAAREEAARCKTERDDIQAAADIETSALKSRTTVLREQVRNLESRHAVGTAKYTELQEAYGVLEARLERLNKPTTAVVSRDPAMTPRPSKKDIITRVPKLGSTQHYASTQAILDALIESVVELERRTAAAENTADVEASKSKQAFADYRQQVKDRLLGIVSASTATQTEQV